MPNSNRLVRRCCASGCFISADLVAADLWLCAQHRLSTALALKGDKPTALIVNPYVYYVAWSDRDVVKIGTTTNLRKRLNDFGSTAKVLVAEPGSYKLERQRHLQFAHLRVSGELFRWCPLLADHIDEVRQVVGWKTRKVSSRGIPS